MGFLTGLCFCREKVGICDGVVAQGTKWSAVRYGLLIDVTLVLYYKFSLSNTLHNHSWAISGKIINM